MFQITNSQLLVPTSGTKAEGCRSSPGKQATRVCIKPTKILTAFYYHPPQAILNNVNDNILLPGKKKKKNLCWPKF